MAPDGENASREERTEDCHGNEESAKPENVIRLPHGQCANRGERREDYRRKEGTGSVPVAYGHRAWEFVNAPRCERPPQKLGTTSICQRAVGSVHVQVRLPAPITVRTSGVGRIVERSHNSGSSSRTEAGHLG